jgi:hypothetical protein
VTLILFPAVEPLPLIDKTVAIREDYWSYSEESHAGEYGSVEKTASPPGDHRLGG